MQSLKKILPWAITLILAALWAWLGSGSPEPGAPAEPMFVTVRDTVRDTVWNEARVPARVVIVRRDTVERDPGAMALDGEALRRLIIERDSLNFEILRLGETRADIDTTITIALGDSSSITLEVRVSHEIERGYTTLALRVAEAVLTQTAVCPSNTWSWITAAGAAIAAVLAVIIK
ncbi:MAG: hypothetical protein M5R41_10365 [Bacteroidia bacterium]|nr:hypothetical protein [Bacteroidia bacterium]